MVEIRRELVGDHPFRDRHGFILPFLVAFIHRELLVRLPQLPLAPGRDELMRSRPPRLAGTKLLGVAPRSAASRQADEWHRQPRGRSPWDRAYISAVHRTAIPLRFIAADEFER